MKSVRLVPTVVACSLVLTAAVAFACGDKFKTATTAAKGKVSAVTASAGGAACTAEQMAACAKDKGGKVTTAAMTAAAGDACCMSKKAKASNTTATVAPVGKVNAMAVGHDAAGGSCGAKSGTTAMAAGASCGAKSGGVSAMTAGSSCGGHGITGTARVTNHDCDACADFAMCEDEVQSSGATVQVVPLKNGVMYVYTASGPSKVQAVQAAMTRRNQQMSTLLTSGDKASLCPECKVMRGAIASGKLSRETVNIEGGCMTLVTSSDARLVGKLHALAGVKNGRKAS